MYMLPTVVRSLKASPVRPSYSCCLPSSWQTGFFQQALGSFLIGTPLNDGLATLHAKRPGSHTEVSFEQLADVHAATGRQAG